MFSGAWRESKQDITEIKITDPNINLESLCRVLGSFYLGEITLEPAEVVPTLATATFFHLDGIIDYCTEIMIETMNADTAVTYYYAAYKYGVKKVMEEAYRWLFPDPVPLYFSNCGPWTTSGPRGLSSWSFESLWSLVKEQNKK
jgi:BTB/POZ domain-containing protein 13